MSEFSRPIRSDTLGAAPRRIAIEAQAEERTALARRFGLIAIDRLEAEAEVARTGEEVRAEGRLKAEVTQRCVATGAGVPQTVDEPFAIVFRPHPKAAGPDEEIELDAADLDVVFYAGGAVDLGEAAAETLALALDPYPRAEGADAALKAAGVKDEGEAGPFGALAALRDKLGK
jgi:uncharacterized metal-binding protein YceD (DUF177 family)